MILKKLRSDYRWVTLVVCFLMEFLCLGFCSSNMGLYTVSVTEALNIDRLTYSYWSSIRYGVQVFVALFFGTMVNRFGIRKMVFVGLAAMLGTTLLRMFGNHVAFFYLAGALHGIGIVFVGGTMAGTIVRRWFKQDIGKYTGIVMSANGIGGAVASQIITPIINAEGQVYGYRNAYFISAVVVLLISAIILIFLRDNPTEGAIAGKQVKKAKGAIWTGIEYSVAKRKPYFYLIAALVFLTGISLQSIGNITIVYLTDLGIPTTILAVVSTLSSLTLTFSKLLVGSSYDKFGLRITLLICQICALCTFILQFLLTNSTLGIIMALTATMLSSIALPMETVMLPLIANDLFGSASYIKVLGILMAMNSLGLCLGSPMGELFHQIFGDYRACFLFFGITMILVIISYQFIINAASKDKAAILAAESPEIA